MSPPKLSHRRLGAAFRLSSTLASWLPRYSFLVDRCNSMAQLNQIHAQMIITGRIEDNYAASRLVAFCSLSESGDLAYASKLFSHLREPNLFMWNTLIRAHATTPNPRTSFSLYLRMLRLGFTPGKHTFPFLLKACSNLKSAVSCKQVHGHVLKMGLMLDPHVANGLVRCYCVSAGLRDARKVFDETPERSLSIWTTMICGYAQSDLGWKAIQLFCWMTSERLEPNSVTLASVLSACAQSGGLSVGKQIHSYIEEKKMDMGVILGTALANMYARNGAFVEARKCFGSMTERNIATWNAMICGLAVHGHAREALDFFKNLEDEPLLRPTDITFVGVLSACCHSGMVEFGERIFGSLRSVYGVEPKLEHYSCMVDLLGRSGKLLEAEELVRGMPMKADVAIWGALLNACKNFDNAEVAERVGKEILALDPHSHGVYVVLSNMYAEAGRWEDVSELRKVMKDASVKKTPGWSQL